MSPSDFKEMKRLFDAYRAKELTKYELLPLLVDLIMSSVSDKLIRTEMFCELRSCLGSTTFDLLDKTVDIKRKQEANRLSNK